MITCPKCGKSAERKTRNKEYAIYEHASHNEGGFRVVSSRDCCYVRLTPAATDGGEGSRKWRDMVNALAHMLVDAAGKGYVSSNDLDYANDCLDEIHRLREPRRR